MSKPLLSFRPKPEIAEIIQTLAAEDRRPVGQFLANLVEDAIAQRRAFLQKQPSQQHAA
jgi:hypothetical protein